ncbi:hypothetical protein DPMN_163323, partial [Dreissena polymorpha]
PKSEDIRFRIIRYNDVLSNLISAPGDVLRNGVLSLVPVACQKRTYIIFRDGNGLRVEEQGWSRSKKRVGELMKIMRDLVPKAKVNRVAYGKQHHLKIRGMPCFDVNTKLGT